MDANKAYEGICGNEINYITPADIRTQGDLIGATQAQIEAAIEILVETRRQELEDGPVKVSHGVTAWTQEAIITDQLTWDDEDPQKETDFTGFEFWVTTDSGDDPQGFDDLEDLLDSLPE